MIKDNSIFDYVVVGGGPSGMFFAYEMIEKHPEKRVLIIERGMSLKKRACPKKKTGVCANCKPFCHITNGSSGAGAFSDGKLSLYNPKDDDFYVGGNLHKYAGVDRTKKLVDYTDSIYLKFGATTELKGTGNQSEVTRIRKKAESVGVDSVSIPIRHLGTDDAQILYKGFEKYLEEKGIVTLFETEVTDLIVENNAIKGVIYKYNNKDEVHKVFSDKVIIAVGRDGSEWLEKMCDKHKIDSSPAVIDVGIRYELPDSVMHDINTFMYEGKFVGKPNPFNDKVRTFCQNPSGFVISEVYSNGLKVANGHSTDKETSENTNLALLVSVALEKDVIAPLEYARNIGRNVNRLANGHSTDKETSENTNLALLVSVALEKDVIAPLEYARNIGRNVNRLAKGEVMVQRLGDIKAGVPTLPQDLEKGKNKVVPTLESAVPGDICLAMPYRELTDILEFIQMLDKVVPGFADDDNLVYAPELKFYSNKLDLSNSLETSISGLYAIGDGCGLTRGLMMASASGVYLAQKIC